MRYIDTVCEYSEGPCGRNRTALWDKITTIGPREWRPISGHAQRKSRQPHVVKLTDSVFVLLNFFFFFPRVLISLTLPFSLSSISSSIRKMLRSEVELSSLDALSTSALRTGYYDESLCRRDRANASAWTHSSGVLYWHSAVVRGYFPDTRLKKRNVSGMKEEKNKRKHKGGENFVRSNSRVLPTCSLVRTYQVRLVGSVEMPLRQPVLFP